jgi:hypothetical protein
VASALLSARTACREVKGAGPAAWAAKALASKIAKIAVDALIQAQSSAVLHALW